MNYSIMVNSLSFPIAIFCIAGKFWNSKRILRGISIIGTAIEADIGHTEVLEDLKEGLTAVIEGHGAVMGIALLDQHVTVEAAHLRNGKDTDAAEGTGGNRKHLALCDIGAELTVAVALETVEGDGRGGDIALQRAASEIGIASLGLKETVLNELILHGALGAHLASGGVTAVEAHKGIGQLVIELAGDILVVKILRHRVIDIQKGHRILGDAGTDVLRESAVNIDLTGHRNAAGGKTGVDVAGLKAKLLGEGRPALVGEADVLSCTLVILGPIQQRQLELCHAGQERGIAVTRHTKLGSHILADGLDTGIVLVCLVGHQQIQLGVLLDLNAQLIQTLDGGVAGEEILRTGAEGDDLEALDTNDGTGNRQEITDHSRTLVGSSHGILGNVSAEMAHTEVIRAIEHTAVGIAAAADEIAVALGCRHVHDGTVKLLAEKGFGSLGAEVTEINHEGITTSGLHAGKSLENIVFVFNDGSTFVEVDPLGLGGLDHRLTAAFGKGAGKAVTAHRNNGGANSWEIFHKYGNSFLL